MFCVLSTYRKPPQPLFDEAELREALRMGSVPISKSQGWTDIDARQFDRQLRGVEHLYHGTLGKLPVRFHQWYHLLMIERVGLPKEVRRALPLQIALMGRKRMARAERLERKEKAS